MNERADMRAPRPVLPRIDIACAVFIATVVLVQIVLYCTYPATPFHHPTHGWEGWADQGLYLKSARALAALDLSASQHWYPIGYALLAAPFVPLFSDPFFVPNLLCMVAFAWMFQRYFRPLIGMAGVAVAFFGVLLLPMTSQLPLEAQHFLWLQFVIPWTTVPIAPLLMAALCFVCEPRDDDRVGKDFLIGALAGAVAGIKPVELVPLAVLAIWYLAVTLRDRATAVRRIGMAACGALVVGGAVLGLEGHIHPGFSSPYTRTIGHIGMSLSNLPQRAIDLFVDAGPSYGEPNTALMRWLPWFPILAPLALVGAVLRWRELVGPVALAAAAFVTYLAYNDFGPTNVLHYFLIHYVAWTLPVIAASGLYMAVCAARRPRLAIPCAVAIGATLIVASLRIELRPAPFSHIESRMVSGGRAFDVDFAAPTHLDAIDLPPNLAVGALNPYDNPLKFAVDQAPLKAYSGYRMLDLPDRLRVIFTRPVNATHVSFEMPGVDATAAVAVRPIRFSLRLASGPWAKHSANLDAIAQ